MKTSNNNIQIFKSEVFGQVRTMTNAEGETFFVGRDVAKALGYCNTRDALRKHVDDEDKGVAKCDTLGGTQKTILINESGLYALILSSKLPQAKAFNRLLEALRIQHRVGGQWVLFAPHQGRGYVHSYTTYHTSSHDGYIRTQLFTRWTQLGRRFLYDRLRHEGIHPNTRKDTDSDGNTRKTGPIDNKNEYLETNDHNAHNSTTKKHKFLYCQIMTIMVIRFPKKIPCLSVLFRVFPCQRYFRVSRKNEERKRKKK